MAPPHQWRKASGSPGEADERSVKQQAQAQASADGQEAWQWFWRHCRHGGPEAAGQGGLHTL